MLFRNFKPFAIITLFVFGVYSSNLTPLSVGRTYVFGDTAIYALYLSSLSENLESLLTFKNNFLFWNQNYLSVGIPTLSIVDMGVLYPPNYLIAFLARLLGNTTQSFSLYNFLIFIHLLVSSFFVYKLLLKYWKVGEVEAFIGSFMWSFVGFNTEFIGAAAIFLAGSYLPLCLYLKLNFLESKKLKYFALYFLVLSLSFLAGYPIVSVVVYLTCTFFEFFLLESQELKNLKAVVAREFIGLFLILFPIISPLYLSAALNFTYSIRGRLTLEGFLSNAAKISNLTESVFPKNTPFNTESKTNLVYLYFSLVGMLAFINTKNKLIIFKDKKNKAGLFLAVFGLILSLGKITLIPFVLYYVVPFFSFFRRLSVFSILPGFFFCIFTSLWLGNIKNSKEVRTSVFNIMLLTFSVVFLVIVVLLGMINPQSLSYYIGILIVLIVLFTTYGAFLVGKHIHLLFSILLFLAIFIEAFINVKSKFYLNSEVAPVNIFKQNALTSYIKDNVKLMERVDLLSTQHSYSTDYLGIEQTAGYLSLASAYGTKINDVLTNIDLDRKNLRDILGVRYVVKKNRSFEPDLILENTLSYKPGSSDFYYFNYDKLAWEIDTHAKYYIYSRDSYLPRIYTASKIIPKEKLDDTTLHDITHLKNPTQVYISRKDYVDEKISANSEIEILEYKRNYLKLASKSSQKTFLANSTGYFSGWWARINGKWVKPVQTNWFMMGVYVSKGNNIVEFVYFPYGVILSTFYLLLAFFMWILRIPVKLIK